MAYDCPMWGGGSIGYSYSWMFARSLLFLLGVAVASLIFSYIFWSVYNHVAMCNERKRKGKK